MHRCDHSMIPICYYYDISLASLPQISKIFIIFQNLFIMALSFHFNQPKKLCRACLKEGLEFISLRKDLKIIFNTCTGILVCS